jgi:hypothetical protein
MATKKTTKKGSGAPGSRSTRRAGPSARPRKGAGAKRTTARGRKTQAKAASKRPAPRSPRAGTPAASKRTRVRAPKTEAKALSRGSDREGAAAPAKRVERVVKPKARPTEPGKSRRKPAALQSPERSRERRAPPAVRRRDGTGHIDPRYAADLLAQRGTSDRDDAGPGFVENPRSGDDLAENLAEEFVASATSGENQEEEVLDQEVPEERGGPFVESSGGTEFGWGTDDSNPKSAKREPFPTT